MWSRLFRAVTALLNFYSFYTSPLRFIFSVLIVMVVPYFIYILWGSLLFMFLSLFAIYLFIRHAGRRRKGRYY